MTSDSQSESGGVVSSTAWFSIDTAPTDGTLFIGLKGKHVAPTKRGKYYVKWPHQPGGPTFEERWKQVQPDHIFPWNPTHWTPMPNKK